MSDDGDRTCPLCAEEMDLTDQQLKPCKCGYEVCVPADWETREIQVLRLKHLLRLTLLQMMSEFLEALSSIS